jgi:hypothetical protein
MAESNQNIDVLLALKSAVLNIDWEISDETLDELSQEVTQLQTLWSGEKVLLVYLQIIGALCQYISMNREQSHPGTFVLLKDVFDGLEKVIVTPEMSQSEKNNGVMAYADRYNTLKQDIAAGNFIPDPPREQEAEEPVVEMQEEEDSSADTAFDSMLNAMVQSEDEASDDISAEQDKPDVVEEAESPADVVEPPSERPAVQAVFNKDDGTEVDPDRNEDDEFVEADELLDDFFEDDDVPAPDIEFCDSDDEQKEDGDLSGADNDKADLNIADSDGGDVVIELDDEEEQEESFQEMEETLDDFFAEEEEEDFLDPFEDGDDDSLIEDALDDFFGDGEDEPLSVNDVADVDESLELDIPEEETLSLEPEEAEHEDSEKDGSVDSDDSGIAEEPVISESDVEDVLEEEAALPDESADIEDEPDTSEEEKVEFDVDEPDDAPVDSELSDDKSSLIVSAEPGEIEEPVAAEESAGVDEPVTDQDDSGLDGSCVENLQMLLLSVEWEVDDQLLLRLEEEIESLSTLLQDNASATIHLKFLGAVIRYISREQADVISDSMTCLKLLADSLESLLFDQTGNVSLYEENAVRSFVDWHELVVLDFEEQLSQVRDQLEDVSAKVFESGKSADAVVSEPVLSVEMQVLKDSILQEVRTLIALEIADLKES